VPSLRNLKLPFTPFTKFFSQAGQDVFVLSCLNGKRDGKFLDLGCNHPQCINNTALLEYDFGWTGASFDINGDHRDAWIGRRRTPIVIKDCTELTTEDFASIAETVGSTHIDYLSIDLEPAASTLACLRSIPFDKLSFSIITYEHEFFRYAEGGFYRSESRRILEGAGYAVLCSNVANENCVYEDWYVNPVHVDMQRVECLRCDGKNWPEILFVD